MPEESVRPNETLGFELERLRESETKQRALGNRAEADTHAVHALLLALERGEPGEAARTAKRLGGAARDWLRAIDAWAGLPGPVVRSAASIGFELPKCLTEAFAAEAVGATSDAIDIYRLASRVEGPVRCWSRARLALLYLERGEPRDLDRIAELMDVGRDETRWVDRLQWSALDALRRARSTDADPTSLLELGELAEATRRSELRSMCCRLLLETARLESEAGDGASAEHHRLEALELFEAMALRLAPEKREAFWQVPWRNRARAATRGAPSHTSSARPEDRPMEASLARLFELLRRLATESDLDRLLSRINESAVELSGAERGVVLLLSDGQLEPYLSHHARRLQRDDPSVAFSRSIAETVLIDGEPLVTVDATDDVRLSDFLSVHHLLLRSVACLPIAVEGETLGALYLEDRGRVGRFDSEGIAILQALADQAAIALRNTRLRDELERTNSALRRSKEELEELLDARIDELADARRQLGRERFALDADLGLPSIVGNSPAMMTVFKTVQRLRIVDVPVVIEGESGTGKELFAKAIHETGRRSHRPFVALNCGAIPETLLESELFGHVRGAFTGATRDRRGVFARAHGGTLFLDEITEMSPKMQVDLLRVLQDGRFSPVGSERAQEVDVRVVCASNRALAEQVDAGLLREDLYYRLNVVTLRLPPLRERREDIPLLCSHFLARAAAEVEERPKRLSRDALSRLMSAEWPGNVRQLEHVLTSATVLVNDEVIEAEDLRLFDATPSTSASGNVSKPRVPETLSAHRRQERARIVTALENAGWNRSEAARALGLPRRTLYRRLKEYGILD